MTAFDRFGEKAVFLVKEGFRETIVFTRLRSVNLRISRIRSGIIVRFQILLAALTPLRRLPIRQPAL